MTPVLTDASWRKSTHSGGNEGSCVEVAVVGLMMGPGA
ncbi:DUF397 domain-containing protein [Actinoallomurus rhizosphaericola]